MNYIGIAAAITSHILASLYMTKRKYSNFLTVCLWSLYAICTSCVVLLTESIILGFFFFFLLHLIVFCLASEGSLGENVFLFLTYANSFCICIGANCFITAFLENNTAATVLSLLLLALIHLFLYKVIIPTYKKARMFCSTGWWKFNFVFFLFLIRFLTCYAFNIVDKSSARNLIFDFVLFGIIFYSTLLLIFTIVKNVAEINKRAIENDALRNVAFTDTLTGLKNRSAYAKFARAQILSHKNNKKTKRMFVLIDIDDFKNINDTKGHSAGDEILKQIGALIADFSEASGCESFRIGGDEFALIFDDMPSDDVENLLNKMNDDIYAAIGVTLSFGTARLDFENLQRPFDTAFAEADKAMYANKQKKKSEI